MATDIARLQRRTVTILALGQILGAFGTGAGFAMGSLMAVNISGNPALGGLSATAGMSVSVEAKRIGLP
jgi:Na+-transporting methylmalonyl-CoA/oxaloacetate decarboxylase beta subunit